MLPSIAITMGDINGVGPEILVQALCDDRVRAVCRPIVAGSLSVYEGIAAAVPGACEAVPIHSFAEAKVCDGGMPVFEAGVDAPARRPGILDSESGRAAMQWLDAAAAAALTGQVDAVVTCPINKAGIHAAGYGFRGHTDFLAAKSGVESYRMALFAGGFRVVHVSDHVSLRDALDALSVPRIVETAILGDAALRALNVPHRRIALAGVNPHAGEGGAFGAEDAGIVAPAVAACSDRGLNCTGPVAPDTVFRQAHEGAYDMVIAMYHDQGHIPVKMVAMDDAVNVTLGLPFARTSPAHGTAYDIAGKGIARPASLIAAVALAAQLCERRGAATLR